MTRTPASMVARNFLALGTGEASARVIAFIATVYVARALGSTSFGIVAFSAAVLLYLARIVDGGLDLGVGIQLVASKRSRIERLGFTLLACRTVLAVVTSLALLAVGTLLLPQPDGGVLSAFGLLLLPLALNTRWIHLGLERARFVAIARVLGELAMVALVVAFVRGPNDLVVVPLAQFAGDALAAALLAGLLFRWGHRPTLVFRWRALRPILRRAIPLIFSSLLGLIVYNSDLVFLRVFRDSSAVGLYVAAYALIAFLGNLAASYGMSLLPTLSRLPARSEDRLALYRTAMAQLLAVALPITVGGYLLAPDIIHVVFGEEYGPAAVPLQILIWTVSIMAVREVARVGLLACGREDRILGMNLWATIVNLLSNVILIPLFGMVGAAAATLGTDGVRLAIAQLFASREGLKPSGVRRYWRPVVATVAMAAALVNLDFLQLWLAVLAGAAIYLLALMLTGGVRLRWSQVPEFRI